MNWGILGAGSVAQRRVIPAIHALDGQQISGLLVRDIKRAEQLVQAFDAGKAYDQVDALVEDANIDAVYVSSPVNLHHEHVLKVAAAGKHVLCEKPMAMSSAECESMIAACEKAGVGLGICFVLRGWPIYQSIRTLIEEGQLGTIVEMRSHLAKWSPREIDDWRLDPVQSGGGTLIDVATHYLDLFRFLTGEITKVAYMGSSRVFDWPVEETAHTLLEFASGVHGSVTASCTIPSGSNVLEIFGSEGSVFLGKTFKAVKGDDVQEEDVVYPDYYSGLLRDFVSSVSEGRQPIASGHDGLRGMQIVEAAYRSEEHGLIVSV
jgi:1,5-anhydro-D-fructose reductase (1,5-anhydro-D-mannitol-forming)